MPSKSLKLDLGCGRAKKEGFEGVDIIKFPGVVDHVVDLLKPWPWANDSVDEANCSHVIEHFTSLQRIHICNELYRVLRPGGYCTMSAPHWSSGRSYGDPTHVWPPISEDWLQYLSKSWRNEKAPHTDAKHMKGGLSCDFEVSWIYAICPAIFGTEREPFAVRYLKDAIDDIIVTLRAKKIEIWGRTVNI